MVWWKLSPKFHLTGWVMIDFDGLLWTLAGGVCELTC